MPLRLRFDEKWRLKTNDEKVAKMRIQKKRRENMRNDENAFPLAFGRRESGAGLGILLGVHARGLCVESTETHKS